MFHIVRFQISNVYWSGSFFPRYFTVGVLVGNLESISFKLYSYRWLSIFYRHFLFVWRQPWSHLASEYQNRVLMYTICLVFFLFCLEGHEKEFFFTLWIPITHTKPTSTFHSGARFLFVRRLHWRFFLSSCFFFTLSFIVK